MQGKKKNKSADNSTEKYIDLDKCVINALNLIDKAKLPKIPKMKFKRPLIVGSGNAAVTGRMLFENFDAVFADESNYLQKIKAIRSIDGAIIISASGAKHSPIIARELKKRNIASILFTNNKDAPAMAYAGETLVFPKNTEPYTYNTSTYLSMIFSMGKENASEIKRHITGNVRRKIPRNLKNYNAYFIIIPDHLELSREMFLTKFDELFGSRICGRVFTEDEAKHAKTLVPNPRELFIGLGVNNKVFGRKENRIDFSLPNNSGYASIIAEGYYIIGNIQKQNPPYFKNNIKRYAQEASAIFNQDIDPIVR